MPAELYRVGCPECDLMAEFHELSPGERARCGRCGFIFSVCFDDPFTRCLSFSVAALVVLGIAFSFPFLTITAAGISNSMTLVQTVDYLVRYDAYIMAFLLSVFVILVPTLMLVLMTVISLSLYRGRFHPLLTPPTRWLFHLNAWSMTEVFAIGVIVSLVKLAAMAKVEIGPSFWAYLVFTALFLLAFSAFDRLTIWTAIDRIRRQATV